jgi:NTP pyrophosphatase (non-canonical NTP hydrolase)
MKRTNLSNASLDSAKRATIEALTKGLQKYGRRSFASTHEIHGAIAEEWYELNEAIRKCQPNITGSVKAHPSIQQYRDELLDIIVCALVGVASIDNDSIDAV